MFTDRATFMHTYTLGSVNIEAVPSNSQNFFVLHVVLQDV